MRTREVRKIIIGVALLLLGNSCYYTDGERFEVNVIPLIEPEISITSNLPELDSLARFDSLLFEYQIKFDTGKLFYSNLYLGNYWIHQSDTTKDELWIKPPHEIVDGLYDLTLVVFHKSFTGRLADILNAEPIITDTTWQIIIYSENEQNAMSDKEQPTGQARK